MSILAAFTGSAFLRGGFQNMFVLKKNFTDAFRWNALGTVTDPRCLVW